MKKMKSLLCWALMSVLLLGMSVNCMAAVNPFTDVKKSDYYYGPVLWAVENNITAGTSKTTFSPNAACTRAQTVTFLWRAAGCPATTGKTNPFTDVKKSDYFYNAVLWAVENSVTAGTSKTTFSPNDACTRGQIVTFMWRSEGALEVSAANPFTDVKKSDYYYNAVLWAVKNEVTTGVSKDAFAPGDTCTRGQIVTFLYRYVGSSFDILIQPANYFMTSSSADASFTVNVTDGIAPYTYQWYVCYDNKEVPLTPVITSATVNTSKHQITDYDFDDYNTIRAYCVITDALGHTVKSNYVNVVQYVSMRITAQPVNYQMTSSSEDASFHVNISGGMAPYTYQWYVCYDGDKVPAQSQLDIITGNTFIKQFTDYDFDDYRTIEVYCVITDSANHSVTTNYASVLQKH